jgi:hypothetical protein
VGEGIASVVHGDDGRVVFGQEHEVVARIRVELAGRDPETCTGAGR